MFIRVPWWIVHFFTSEASQNISLLSCATIFNISSRYIYLCMFYVYKVSANILLNALAKITFISHSNMFAYSNIKCMKFVCTFKFDIYSWMQNRFQYDVSISIYVINVHIYPQHKAFILLNELIIFLYII